MNCQRLTLKREQCHRLYGKLGEDCLVEELEEKRCVAFQHCPRQARAFYGTLSGEKAVCASWAEAFCFGKDNFDISYANDQAGHHLKAQAYVNANNKARTQCRVIAHDLANCIAQRMR